MNNKENEEQETLTPEQRARISLNFRAAKALLARKKPRLSFSTPPHFPLQNSHQVEIKSDRTPLQDLPTNIDERFTISPTFSSLDRVCGSSITKKSNVSPHTPISTTPPEQRIEGFGTTTQCSSTSISSLLDDDFDESILKEIDSLCERSSVKSNVENPERVQDDRDVDSTKQEKELCLGMPENYSKYVETLNQDQLEAASTAVDTPLMVVAGPGSGKTSTMVGRVLMLLSQDIGPSHILAMTFTTAAVSEMRDRIGAIAGKEIAKELTISTYHSFSLQLCCLHADKLGRTSEFLIYGHGQQRRAVVEAVRLLESEKGGQSLDACEPRESSDDTKIQNFKDKSQKWQKFVNKAKASGRTIEECHQKGDKLGAAILKNYNDILRSCNALDYHDLISCSVKLLTDCSEVLEECQASWKAVIVDEFQDTSAMQYSLLRLLASHGRITVVGDDDQSIFSLMGQTFLDLSPFVMISPTIKRCG